MALEGIDRCLELLEKPGNAPSNGEAARRAGETAATSCKPRDKVLVSGCFDLLHSGHVEFFRQAATYGDLYVRLGTDANIELLKHHKTMFDENERLFMVQNLSCVHNAELSKGTGMFDFETDMQLIKPNIYFVNEDASQLPERVEICQKYGIKMVVAKRRPNAKLKARSSTDLKAKLLNSILSEQQNGKESDKNKNENERNNHKFRIHNDLKNIHLYNEVFPWRLCLAGGWLDLDWCNKYRPGPVITINVKYNEHFQDYCGLATSSRKHAIKLWNGQIPSHLDAVTAAEYLWGAENFDSFGNLRKKYIAGSQDHLGLFMPGINKLCYNEGSIHPNGRCWPDKVVNMNNLDDGREREIFKWFESVLHIIKSPDYFGRRNIKDYDSQRINYMKDCSVSVEKKRALAQAIAKASELAWEGIVSMDVEKLGRGLSDTMKAWEAMVPFTVNPSDDEVENEKIKKFWKQYDVPHTKGCLFSGAGGGFIFVINDKPVENSFKVEINHEHICKPFKSGVVPCK